MKFSKVKFLGIKIGFLAVFLGFLASFANAADLAELAHKCRNNGGQFCQEAFSAYKKACENGDKTACGNVGQYLLNGTGTQANPQEAASHLMIACDGGLAQYCFALGTNYNEGTNGISKDQEKASDLFKKACSLGFVAACKK